MTAVAVVLKDITRRIAIANGEDISWQVDYHVDDKWIEWAKNKEGKLWYRRDGDSVWSEWE